MQLLSGHRKPIQALAYSPDGRLLASGSDDGSVLVWEVGTGEVEQSLHRPPPQPWHGNAILCVAISPDGRWLVTGDQSCLVRVWDLVAGVSTCEDSLLGRSTSGVAFSLDGMLLVIGTEMRAGDEPNLWLWPVESFGVTPLTHKGRDQQQRRLGAWNIHKGVWSLAVAPDSRTLVVSAGTGDLHFLDLTSASEEPVHSHHYGMASRAVAVSPDGRTLAVMPGNLIELWNMNDLTTTPRVLRNDGITLSSLAFTPDSRLLLTGGWDSTVRVWNVFTGGEVYRFDWKIGRINAVAVSPDGMTAAAAGPQSCDIVLFDLDV